MPDTVPTLASFAHLSTITVEQALVNHRWVRDICGPLCMGNGAIPMAMDMVAATSLATVQHDAIVYHFKAGGQFSTSSAFRLFFVVNTDFGCASAIWKCKAPRLKFFMWLVVHNRCMARTILSAEAGQSSKAHVSSAATHRKLAATSLCTATSRRKFG